MATKTATKPAAPPKPQVEVFDCRQGEDPWKRLRCGLPTASNFHAVLAQGKDGGESKTRNEYMRKLAGEILTGEPAESYKNAAMERGNLMESEARAYYQRTNFVTLRQVGFIKRTLPSGLVVGCSPDSLVDGEPGALELKTQAPHLLIETLMRGTFPSEHRAQTQGILWVADLEWIDLQIWYRGMPTGAKFRAVRDEQYIKALSDAVEVFAYDVKKLVQRVRSMAT